MDKIESFYQELRAHVTFFWATLKTLFTEPFEGREFLYQLATISWRALPTILAAGLFVGAIIAIQFQLQLRDFGAESALGGLSTSSTLREVGPVLIAFMLAGKVGAFTAAELGTMRVSEQIEATRCLGINSMAFWVLPRFLAVVVSSMLLLTFGLVIAVVGGMVASKLSAGIYPQQYLSSIPRFATSTSIVLATVKAFVFGTLMGHICCANGFWTTGGSQGVGNSVRRTAVQSMVCIVLADFSITWLLNAYLKASGQE